MFNKLMIGPGDAATPTGPNPKDLDRLRAKKKSVLDAVRGDLQSLMMRINRDDRSRLEQHLEGIGAIEKRLTQPLAAAGVAAPPPRRPAATLATGGRLAAQRELPRDPRYPDQASGGGAGLQPHPDRDVAVVALVLAHPPHLGRRDRRPSHAVAQDRRQRHQESARAEPLRYGGKFADLLGQLDAVKEGNGTLLDNTVVVWGHEAATGLHDASRAVTVMAGRCGGKINAGEGRLLEMGTYDWAQLLVTLCHAMGVTDVSKVGELPMKTGDIPTLLG